MSKEAFYFSHDYNARNDAKIKGLLATHGMIGYGLYWAIIEDLYNNNNLMPFDCETLGYSYRVKPKLIESILKDFELFFTENNFFSSNSVQKRLDERKSKSIKASESANKRWNKDANALHTESEPNAIKERKGKERKGKDIEERKLKFASSIKPFNEKYTKQLLNDFYKYWTEPNKQGTKFRQELEKTWDMDRRLETWAKNDRNFRQQGKLGMDEKTGIGQNNELR